MSQQNNWKEIWDKRNTSGSPGADVTLLDHLIQVDGFDTSMGRITSNEWRRYSQQIAAKLNIHNNDSIFEVGCGAGAFLLTFDTPDRQLGGIDFSTTMIDAAKRNLPAADLSVQEAAHLDTDRRYDFVIANSCFSYFPDFTYAENVVDRMMKKAMKGIAILDVPDLRFRDDSERTRSQNIKNYKELYKDLRHLYYDRNLFINIARKYNVEAEIFDQGIENYGNSSFRFNCVITFSKHE